MSFGWNWTLVMKSTLILSALWFLAGLVILTSIRSVSGGEPPRFSDRGIFVFGELMLDFEFQVEVLGRRAKLTNCSTQNYYCARAYYVHVALPRRCEPLMVGKRWVAEEVQTEVLAAYEEKQIAPMAPENAQQAYLLGSAKFPDTVYEYTASHGVTGMYFGGGIDLAKFARAGTLTDEKWRKYYLPLLTLDDFGKCS